MSPQRCTGCAAQLRDRDSRFCGVCGALLPPSTPDADRPGGADRGVATWWQRHGARAHTLRRRGLVGLVAGVVLLVVAVVGGVSDVTTTPAEQHVDLPAETEVADRAVDRVEAGRLSPGSCAPPGCVVWSVEAGFGPALVHDGRVFHLDAGELVVWDAASGEQLARTRSLVAGPVAQPWLMPIEHPAGDLVVAAASVGGGLEVWHADELELAWRLPTEEGGGAGELLQATATSVVVVRPRLDGDGHPAGLEVVGHDPVSGAERWSAAGTPTAADGLIVLRPEEGVGQELLLDPATGEQVLATPIGSYAGSSTDRVAVEGGGAVEVLSWPDGERVATLAARDDDEQVRFVSGLVARGPSGWAATPEDWLGMVTVESGLTTEVIDPAHGRSVASFGDRPAVVGAGPDGDDAIVVEEHGDLTSVSRVTPSFERRWRSEVPWGSKRVLRVRSATPGLVVVDTVGADGAVVYWRFDARNGLPVADGGFGDTAPDLSGTGRFEDLSIRWEADQTVVVGPAGLARFTPDVEVLHPGDPLLVRDDGRIIAVDAARAGSR